MPRQGMERGPRGRYARLICQGCRSRKIKCVLPDQDDVGRLGLPRHVESRCERCRNFDLECIVERTTLGRPATKRARHLKSQSKSPVNLEEPVTRGDGLVPTLCNLEIKGYLFSGATDDNLILQTESRPNPAQRLNRETMFQAMIDHQFFFSSILGKDRTFGNGILQAASRWDTPLPELISNDLAESFDNYLSWHRFFLPRIPSLASMRNRLSSDESASTNPATNLLFALLCLTVIEIMKSSSPDYSDLKWRLHIAVLCYGQEFVFSPPTHRDSVTVCLFLADYKPTVLATSPKIARRAIKPDLYVNLAYRITERLEMLVAPDSSSLSKLKAGNCLEFEQCLTDSLQSIQVLCYDILLDGYLARPLHALRCVIGRMKPHLDTYQGVLRSRQCSTRTMFQIQWTMSFYILLEALAETKENWNNPETLFMIIEEAERKCFEQIISSNSYLVDVSSYEKQEELSAVRFLLELRFHSVSAQICGLGILYASILSARLQKGKVQEDLEIDCDEAVQISSQVVGSVNNIALGPGIHLGTFLDRFATGYADRLVSILEMFIECTNLNLGGATFHPPLQHLVLENVIHCKNIVENNVIHFRCHGIWNPQFDKHLDLFKRCAQRIESMVDLSGSSIDTAFARGCVYAAASKMIYGLRDLMEHIRTESLNKDHDTEMMGMFDVTAGLTDSFGLEFDSSWAAWNLWPNMGNFDPFESLQNLV